MVPASVDAVLQLYPDRYRSRGFSLPPNGSGFSGAAVLRIETDVGPHCLRRWPDGADPERIRGLHRLLNHVRSRGIDFVAPPVGANDERTLVFAGGRWWQLEPWMPGRADFLARPTDARLAAAVTSLARLNVAMATFEPAGAERTWFSSGSHALAPAVEERIERLLGWSDEKLVSLWTALEQSPETCPGFNAAASSIVAGFCRSAKAIAEELRAARRLRVPVQPCVRDVWHDHIVFAGDTVTGIIDFGAARSDTVAADISRLVGSLVADDSRGWDVALTAYESVRRLSPEELTLVGVLDRSGTLLSGMTWLARRFFAKSTLEPPERVVGRMEQIAERLGRLAVGRAATLP